MIIKAFEIFYIWSSEFFNSILVILDEIKIVLAYYQSILNGLLHESCSKINARAIVVWDWQVVFILIKGHGINIATMMNSSLQR